MFFFGTLIGMYYYPGGYSFFGNFFSDLGMEYAWNNEPNTISRPIFHAAIYILSIACIFNGFLWYSLKSSNKMDQKQKNYSIVGALFSPFSAIFLAGIAIFPKTAEDPMVSPHSISSTIFFLMILIPMLCFYEITRIQSTTKKYTIPGYFYNVILLIYILIPILFPVWVDLPGIIFKPLTQKLLLYSLLSWTISFTIWWKNQIK